MSRYYVTISFEIAADSPEQAETRVQSAIADAVNDSSIISSDVFRTESADEYADDDSDTLEPTHSQPLT